MPDNLRPPRIHVLSKPTGATCNLACAYCFFLDKELLYPSSNFRMSDEMLENYIRQLIESHQTPEVTVAWQGGEPTLMGVDFYRKAIDFQNKYRKPGMTFENTMQTNGTLLDDEWCEFFKENKFLIGISIDGPRKLHDVYRVDKGGKGTFDKVMRGVRLLQKHGVEFNVLVTVNRINADYPLEVYHFLRDEVGTEWIQVIPVIERLNPDGVNVIQQGDTVTERSLQPEQFGRFMIRIFDEWILNDVGEMFVQTFEATARNWMGLPSSGMCVFEETCGLGLALEHNGDLYSCDHFVEPDYLLGNIQDEHMIELASSDQQVQFGLNKRDTLGLNYLCAGWKAFFHRVDEPLKMLTMVMRSGRPASDVMAIMAEKEADLQAAFARAADDKPCPCGSRLDFKQCHGWQRPKRGRKRRGKIGGQARPPVSAGASSGAPANPEDAN